MRTIRGRPESISPNEPRIAAAIAISVAVVAAAWSITDHMTFGTNVFDSGVIDHALWRVAHGFGDVSSLNGRPLFADHPSGILLLLLPVYKALPAWGLPVYFALRAVSAALVVWASWLVAVHFELDQRTRWVLIGATAVGPAMLLVVAAEANTVGLVVGPLALAIALALRRSSPRWFGILVAIVAASRPEIAVGVVALGLVLRKERPSYARIAVWIGAAFSAVGIVWLFLAGDAPGFSGHLGHLGDSFGDALWGAVRHPWDAVAPLFDPTPWASLVIWLAGFGLATPLLSPRWLTATIPLLAIPFLGTWEQADGHIWQYWHLLLPLGMVAAAASMGRKALEPRRFHILVVVFIPLMGMVAIGPIGKRLVPVMSQDGRSASVIVDLIDDTGYRSVSAPDPVVPHLTARDEVHRFPVPFECGALEVAGYRSPDLLPDAVMMQGEVSDDWEGRLVSLGYETVAVEGVFSLWVTDDRRQAPELDCG